MSSTAFILGKKIGEGAYGEVFVAEWSGIHCAAKKLFITLEEFRQVEIQKEISILHQLRHRNIIQFYATHADDEDFYLIMELAEKGDLAGAIRHKALDWKAKTRIAHEIARGLEYIHDLNITHGDLKSGNVLLTKHAEVKLCDFGLAQIRSVSMSKSNGGIKGTIRWMAPELFATRPKYSAKSDIYALGVVMWEMAAECTKPFKAHNNNGVVAALIAQGRREVVPEGTPDEYRRILEQCWDQDPEKRPTAIEVILFDYDPSVDEDHKATDKVDVLNDGAQPLLISAVVGGANTDSEVVVQDMSIVSPSTISAATLVSNLKPDASMANQSIVMNPTETGAQLSGPSSAIQELLQKAAGNDIEAQVMLAAKCEEGNDIPQSYSDAYLWYLRAANKGHSLAQHHLGELMLRGLGTEKDETEAVKWFQKAAEQGNADSCARLGWLSEERGTSGITEAFQWTLRRQLQSRLDVRTWNRG
ncbi:hypothetical protein BGZ73_004329 [Actinomortierella ambigua]|nr:hypothetical protein BGZ73_004329 [Actinomortierella ambigua]